MAAWVLGVMEVRWGPCLVGRVGGWGMVRVVGIWEPCQVAILAMVVRVRVVVVGERMVAVVVVAGWVVVVARVGEG